MKTMQNIKKNKTIRQIYNKCLAKAHSSLKYLIGNGKKNDKENEKKKQEKILNEFINTITSENKNLKPSVCADPPQGKKDGISFIVLARGESLSSGFMNSTKDYREEGIEFIFCIDRNVKNPPVVSLLEGFRKKQATQIIYFDNSDSTILRLKTAIQFAQNSRVMLFTMMDITNRRSLISYLKNILKESDSPVITHSLNKNNLTKNDFLEDPSISALSGCIFETNFLSSVLNKISKDYDYFVPYILFREIADNDILTINGDRYWTINRRTGVTLRELSCLCRDILHLRALWSDQNADELKQALKVFSKFVERYLELVKKNKLHLNCFISTIAIFVSFFINLLPKDDYKKMLHEYSAVFYFDQLLKGDVLHCVHFKIVEKLIPTKENTIAVIETEQMQDLEHCLVPALKEKYDLIYLTKPEFYDYPFFYYLVLRTLIQPAQFIVTTSSLHKFISLGKRTFTLWHGIGMLKKLAFYNKETTPKDYVVTSSKSCVLPWAEFFSIDKDKVLPLGHVQTDCMFDKEFEKVSREKIHGEYGIPNDSKVIFFAPTFRIAKPGVIPRMYYDLHMDIEKLSERLAEKNLYLITKKHHMFTSIFDDIGIDSSGVYTSENKHFIVDTTHNFQELVVSTDIFVTDYSSGIFFAILRDMPVVLYAPDLDEYKEGANGFMINYPEDMAGVFVGEPDIDRFMKAIEDAGIDTHSERYARFKETHVAACDGHVKEKVIKYLSTWDGNQFAKIPE